MSRARAMRLAMDWKRANGGAGWPASKIFPRDDGPIAGTQQVRLGYRGERGDFIQVVKLRFAAGPEPVYVVDRRDRKTSWPRAQGCTDV